MTAIGQPGWRGHAWFLGAAGVCVGAFGWMLTFGSFRLLDEDVFGTFYDHQAAAWLKGRWDVPEAALSGEAFIVDGKIYGYFGPTPALMRLPFVALGAAFGALTRAFMLLDYLACLAGVYALLRLASRWTEPRATPRPWTVVVLTTSAGLGSTLFFLGSRAYVYHEAILCGAAFGLWTVYFALRYLQAGDSRWWIPALACGVLAAQARAPIGLFALSVLAGVAIVHAAARWRAANWKRPLAIVAASGAGFLSFNVVSYIKFGTFEGCPLQYNVQYTAESMAALEHRNFHLSNLRFNADAYLFRPTFSLRGEFPYLYREFADRRKYPESRIAYRDPTLAMPWSMPGLFSLAVVGSLLAALFTPAARRPLAVLWCAGIPLTLAMFAAVAVTQRYLADFCPLLIATAAFGAVAVDGLPALLRRFAAGTFGGLAAAGIIVTLALTLHHQREIVWGVPDDVRRDYQDLRSRVDAFFAAERR